MACVIVCTTGHTAARVLPVVRGAPELPSSGVHVRRAGVHTARDPIAPCYALCALLARIFSPSHAASPEGGGVLWLPRILSREKRPEREGGYGQKIVLTRIAGRGSHAGVPARGLALC
eukprot:6607483-Prymnesium_polylepis.2